MKILIINKRLYIKAGDGRFVFNLGHLLASRGHQVLYWGMEDAENIALPHREYFAPHVDLNAACGLTEKMSIAANLLYSVNAKRCLEKFIRAERPDVVHLNLFTHQISPSIIDVLARERIPMVMSLHDYTMVCPNYMLWSQGAVCDACRAGNYVACFKKKCVKNSRIKSLLGVAEMVLHHAVLRIYRNVNAYISPSLFVLHKHREMGFPVDRMSLLAHFVNAAEYAPHSGWSEQSITFFGRLVPEKGVMTLIEAVRNLPVSLKIIGTGPEEGMLKEACRRKGVGNVHFLGFLDGTALHEEIKKSMFVVVPSQWQEVFGLTILESFALGKPVVGSRVGAIPELINENSNGWLFEPGNSLQLGERIKFLLGHTSMIREAGERARRDVEQMYDRGTYYLRLMEIYAALAGQVVC